MDATSPRFANLSPLKRALLALEDMQAQLAESDRERNEPIAIIGMGCRFPGAGDPAHLWRLLRDGEDAVRPVPESRWNNADYYHPDADAPGKISTQWGGFLDQVDRFDPEFFGISPREAVEMDPQQRLLLEVAWEALENAGQGPRDLAGCSTGVFIGITGDEYAQLFHRQDDPTLFNAYFASGIARSVASGRISYTLGLQGPNLSIDTACSSSLVAVHTACLHLRMGECRMALAGGSNVVLSPQIGIAFSKAHMMAADGRCKTFDSRADGFVRGEGCGIVVLKRLSDALANGDSILALIRGSAVNQDGRSSGLTVPNRGAQEAVIRQALANARVQPLEIGYVEAHGTGTQLGDPIEANALAAVLGPGRTTDNPLLVGSVKTNVGHLESTAGIAGLIKVVLSLQHEEIPRNLHFHAINPHINWEGLPIHVPVESQSWRRGERKRLAGVSAFGFSGTNAHVILEEAPRTEERNRKIERPLHLLALSARSQAALELLGGQYADKLGQPELELGDLCHSANAGRTHFEHRVAVSGASPEELRRKLLGTLPGKRIHDRDGVRSAFLFSGQGSQYAGMGKELYQTHPAFRQTLDQCAELLIGELDHPLLQVLWGDATHLLDQTAYTQPALFAVEFALAELWKSWGILPSVVLGHSVGEYTAACVAGVYSLSDGLKLIAARGRLMQRISSQGAMAAVMTSEDQAREALKGLEERVSIASLNAPESVVISGFDRELAIAEDRLRQAGIRVLRLAVSHGFHSPQMHEIEEPFATVASQLEYAVPRVALISSVTGRPVTRNEMIDPQYWRRQVSQPVRFRQALETIASQGHRVFVEIGPGTALAGLGRQCFNGDDRLWIPSIKKGRGEWQQILEGLERLYVHGAEVNWAGFDAPYGRRRIAMPTYPFERQRYWIETNPAKKPARVAGSSKGHPLLGRRFEVGGDAKTIVWESQIDTEDLPYLADHRAFDRIIFPLTAYLEWITAAVADAELGPHQLQDVIVCEPLVLPENESVTVQVKLRDRSIEVHSRENGNWKLHLTASIAASQPVALCEPLAQMEQRMPQRADVDAFYASVRARGMDFGPAFRSIRALRSTRGESLALVETSAPFTSFYGIHPALLDGCFQALAAVLPEQDDTLYLPIGLERFILRKGAESRVWSNVRLRSASVEKDSVTVDVTVFDETGIVSEAIGLCLRRATRTGFRKRPSLENLLYELRWVHAARPDGASAISGDWLILAPEGNATGASLAQQLDARGARCTILYRPDRLRAEIARQQWHAVVHMWALDASNGDAMTSAGLEASLHAVCGNTLDLVQALAAKEGQPSRLWLVTRGAQATSVTQKSVEPVQATLGGMAQAITEEHPEWQCTCVDLDPSQPADNTAPLLEELCTADREDQVALRGTERLVARLYPKPMQNGMETPQRLTVSARGVLTGLGVEPAQRHFIPERSVEIQVDATGLNFRDVLNVLGMYPGEPGPLGSECAGRIVAVGAGVRTFHEGDEVVAMVSGGHDGFVVADPRLVALKPVNVRVEQAATLPTAFLTARYTLEYLAHIKPGDRVLIHAATGGVGLAALQIAQRAGAEIFATAGNERKRSFLRSLGVRHVMSSRTLDFAREILEQTENRGVDIVLNSLAGEFIAASFSVMAPEGRFLEIGKRDLWTQEQAAQLGRNLTYDIVDLGQVAMETPEVLGQLLRDTVAAVERGELQPLPFDSFAVRDAVDAYRHMAQAQHIGKVVLRQSTCGAAISGQATYLIAGGLGALGMRVARWLVERGGRNIVLTGRNGASQASTELAAWAESHGARIVVRRADVAQIADMTVLLDEIHASMPPLRGVIHTAAVLDDGVLTQQTWPRFARVLAPKATGALILDELTSSLPLDFFVLFSSIAALVGAPGQASYGAANAFQDALAHSRRRRGLPAISINWGAWTEGMSTGEGLAQRREELGIGTLSAEDGLRLLEYILHDAPAQVAAGVFDWNRFARRYAEGAVPARFEGLLHSVDAVRRPTGEPGLLDRLSAAPETARMGILREYVQSVAIRILGFAIGRRIDGQQPLSQLGLDSLMAVEFRNALAGTVRQTLPSTLLFSYPTIEGVTACLAELLWSRPPDPEIQAPLDRGSLGILDNIEELTDEEVDHLLAHRGVSR